MNLCAGAYIDKTRYLVPFGGHIFEVDEFYGDNEGLTLAEVELSSENEVFERPNGWEKRFPPILATEIRNYCRTLTKNGKNGRLCTGP